MSTLKVNKLRDTAGSADAITLDPNGGAVLAGVTTVTSVKVGAAVTITESGIEATGVGITVANINGGQIGGRRNIIINGAMRVAQRGTSSTSTGYVTIDRFNTDYGGENEAPTYEQGTVASGTTPYTEGFRNTWKITNGNQTGGAGSGDYIFIRTKTEAQDLANSGWNYTSSSSFITLSFWVKSSVAQTFYGRLESVDGSVYNYPYSYAVSANTWTKVVKTIPGNSNLQIDNNNGSGMEFHWDTFRGSNFSDSGVALDTWAAYASGTRTPSQTSTWWTTNDATWELTGVQVEVGSQATAFEHRSYGEELELCKRYYQQINGDTGDYTGFSAYSESTTSVRIPVQLHPAMRAAFTNSKSGIFRFQGATNDSDDSAYSFSIEGVNTNFNACTIRNTNYANMGAADRPGNLQFRSDGASLKFDAER